MDELPDELLIPIVSQLSWRERARTSVLAPRWRHIWKFSRVLNFDDPEISNDVRYLQLGKTVGKRDTDKRKFVESVSAVLGSYSGEIVDELRIKSALNNKNAADIDKWIEFAFTKKVKKLELNFKFNTDDGHEHNRVNRLLLARHQRRACAYTACTYTFPDVKYLEFPPSRWMSLMSLSLNQVSLFKDAIESLISNCPNLEDLYIEMADRLESFEPSSQATKLRHLTIINCRELKKIEICSPNLVSYELQSAYCAYTSTKLNGVLSLISLSLTAFSCDELFQQLRDVSGCLSRLETLKLHGTEIDPPGMQFESVTSPKFDFYKSLPRLRKLELEIGREVEDGILCFTPLINAAPFLREIVLSLIRHGNCSRQPARPVMEMVLYVMEKAALLEKVVIGNVAHTGEDLHLLKRNLSASPYN